MKFLKDVWLWVSIFFIGTLAGYFIKDNYAKPDIIQNNKFKKNKGVKADIKLDTKKKKKFRLFKKRRKRIKPKNKKRA